MGFEDILEGIFGQIEQQAKQQPNRRVRGPQPRPAESETGIGRVMKSVVQVVALKSGFLGGCLLRGQVPAASLIRLASS